MRNEQIFQVYRKHTSIKESGLVYFVSHYILLKTATSSICEHCFFASQSVCLCVCSKGYQCVYYLCDKVSRSLQ